MRYFVSHCDTVTLSNKHTLTISHCLIVTLSHCLTVKQSHSHASTLSNCHNITLHCTVTISSHNLVPPSPCDSPTPGSTLWETVARSRTQSSGSWPTSSVLTLAPTGKDDQQNTKKICKKAPSNNLRIGMQYILSL